METNVRNISAASWQMALNDPGGVVLDEHDINQQIRIVLSTRKGDVPGRPDFGSDIPDYVDKPINKAATLTKREALQVLGRHIPSIKVTDVAVDLSEAAHAVLKIKVKWVYVGTTRGSEAEVLV